PSSALQRNSLNPADVAWGGINPSRVNGAARHPGTRHQQPSAIRDLPVPVYGSTPNSTLYIFFFQTGCFLTAVTNLSRQISVLAYRMSFTKRYSIFARLMKI